MWLTIFLVAALCLADEGRIYLKVRKFLRNRKDAP